MKNLHVSEPRCHGRDLKVPPAICPERATCQRNAQLQADRDLGITGMPIVKVMNLPRVGALACTYLLKAVQ